MCGFVAARARRLVAARFLSIAAPRSTGAIAYERAITTQLGFSSIEHHLMFDLAMGHRARDDIRGVVSRNRKV